MAERNEDRYRDEPYRGERGYARDEHGFEDRFIGDTRPWLDEEDAERRTIHGTVASDKGKDRSPAAAQKDISAPTRESAKMPATD